MIDGQKYFAATEQSRSVDSYADGPCIVTVVRRTFTWTKAWVSNCGNVKYSSGKTDVLDKTRNCGGVITRTRDNEKKVEDRGDGLPPPGSVPGFDDRTSTDENLPSQGSLAGSGAEGGGSSVTVRILVDNIPGLITKGVDVDFHEQSAHAAIVIDYVTYKLLSQSGYSLEEIAWGPPHAGSGNIGSHYTRFYMHTSRLDALRAYESLGTVIGGQDVIDKLIGKNPLDAMSTEDIVNQMLEAERADSTGEPIDSSGLPDLGVW